MRRQRYRDQFLNNIDKFAKQEVINQEDIKSQLYKTDSVEELAKNIEHMGKNIPEINKTILEGEPAMPLLMREDGKLKIIGGRTRTSIALMYGKEVTGLVIDKQKMEEAFYPDQKRRFLGQRLGIFCF